MAEADLHLFTKVPSEVSSPMSDLNKLADYCDRVHGDDLDNDVGDDSEWNAVDDVKGGPLPAHLVRDARERELRYLWDRGVYCYASTADAVRATGRRPLRLKWIDTDKGGVGRRNIRSRLVCTEVRRPGTEAIFAPHPAFRRPQSIGR